jgi:TonB family protein
MKSPNEGSKRRLSSLLLSSAFHGVILACILVLGLASRHRFLRPVQTHVIAQIAMAGGSHHVKIPLPRMDTAAHTRKPAPNSDNAARTTIPMQVPPVKKPGGGAPPKPHAGDGSGRAITGNGSDDQDIRPAFPVFAPHPPVSDRSLLPRSEQKIVVDVKLDVNGGVVDAKLVKGVGNKLDAICLATVKTWRFQPATVSGKPVPTEAEVIFPFNPNYPIADS